MSQRLACDIAVIGAGSGGLTIAAAAAQLGLETVLIEGAEMGGDCLNSGCVPSKALIAAADAAAAGAAAKPFGIDYAPPAIDFARVMNHVREIIAAIAPHDSQERFEKLGARVIRAPAQFTGRDRLQAGDYEIRARRFVVATGSHPAVPPVPGLERVPYLTNLTLWDLKALPAHLLILGGGPIGVEMAQAFRRLGARVTILEMARLLPRDDAAAVAVLRARLLAEGVAIEEGAQVTGVAPGEGGIEVMAKTADGAVRRFVGSHLLVAAGRKPAVEGLGLEAAGVALGKGGIEVDGACRTSNRRIYAIGDVAGPYQFTHWAAYQAKLVVRHALFRLPTRAQPGLCPWVTYGDPELAQLGLTEEEARRGRSDVRVAEFDFAHNDRAIAERKTEGFVKIVATARGRILGVTAVGAAAGEVIQPWALALAAGLGLRQMTGMLVPYPTLGEANVRAAGQFFAPRLFQPSTQRLVRFLFRLGC